MSAAVAALLAIIAQIAPSLGVPSIIVTIISTLETLLPTIVKEVQDVAPLIKNIINALRNNSAITDEQKAQLDELEARYDAEFEAAVAMPDSDGMPE